MQITKRGHMSWEDQQNRITREGRLFLAAPEVVFDELKELSRRNRREILSSGTEALEATLIQRNEPLINLGLACYATNKDVFTALYKHSKEPPRDNADAIYKRSLRLGCLSNQTLTAAHLLFDFPRDVIGEQEVSRILLEADMTAMEALASNPAVSDKLLEQIFSMTGAMEQLPEERRTAAVNYAAMNERINTEKEYYDSPDMGHYGIHKAIFRFLEIAPVEPRWFWVVYDVLGKLDPQQVHSPERIDHVLDRWKSLKLGGSKDAEEMEGFFTGLPMREELRCHIAALFGRGYDKQKTIYFGSSTAEDIALRCAHYGCGDITGKEMRAGYERDKDGYVFAACFNSNIMSNRKLRKIFEEEQLSGDVSKLYLKHFVALKKTWPHIGEPFSEELKEEAKPSDPSAARLERIESAAVAVQSKVAAWSSQFQTFQGYAIAIAIGLTILFYLKK
jgi:hypothetical protein